MTISSSRVGERSTALVTGASSGIGRELVRQLVRDRGTTVLATARRGERLVELAGEFPQGSVLTLAGDLADPLFREHLWNHAVTVLGRVDLLVNNAGVGDYSEFVNQRPEPIRDMVALNLEAVLDLSQRAARHMKVHGGGQILQISSVLGFMGMPASAVYTATKHAVNGFTKSLRYELRGTGVRVWAACPGRTESEFRAVALGDRADLARLPRGEPTERVVRAIVRQLDGRAVFFAPTWKSWAVVALATRAPELMDWLIGRFALGSHVHVLRATKPDAIHESEND